MACTRLETLYLAGKSFKGSISSKLGQLTSLRVFHLALSLMPAYSTMGLLPPSIKLCTQLRVIELIQTPLEGFSPSTDLYLPFLEVFVVDLSSQFDSIFLLLVRSFPRLIHFSAVKSRVSGLLLGIESLTELTYLDLSHSRAGGAIPEGFWSMKKLVKVNFANTELYGSISPNIGAMASIQELRLSPGTFGTIPPQIGECASLRLLQIDHSRTLLGSLPAALSNLTRLTKLQITATSLWGSIPEEMANLKNLSIIHLDSNRLSGTLPPSLANMSGLRYFSVKGNTLSGSIPDFPSLYVLDVTDNQFTGTIPPALASHAMSITAPGNQLGPCMDTKSFANNRLLTLLSLSNNRFANCSLPEFSFQLPSVDVYLDHNEFQGTIPWMYRMVRYLDVSFNQLSGHWDQLLLNNPPNTTEGEELTREAVSSSFAYDDPPTVPLSLTHIIANDNRFSGTLPALWRMATLVKVDITNNQWTGPVPALPPMLTSFVAHNNSLSGRLSDDFLDSVVAAGSRVPPDDSSSDVLSSPSSSRSRIIPNSVLYNLDLSHNKLDCPEVDHMMSMGQKMALLFTCPSLQHLSLADNQFSCDLTIPANSRYAISPLLTLDLSRNGFRSVFPSNRLSQLSTLRLSNNEFTGELLLSTYPSITSADLSFNGFMSPISDTLRGASLLISFNGRRNYYSGSLSLQNMNSLETLDLANNSLGAEIDLNSIALHFDQRYLQTLILANNPSLLPIGKQKAQDAFIDRTEASSPSTTFEGGICYTLAFGDRPARFFDYDEPLFNYSQCDCDAHHYGVPKKCIPCPSNGVDVCGASTLQFSRNWFVYSTNDAAGNETIHAEPCALTPEQQIIGNTNCLGFNLTLPYFLNESASLPLELQGQCAEGSEGRLCSRCICDAPDTACYFARSSVTCVKCPRTFRIRESIGLFSGAYVAILLILTIIMALVLRSKRVRATKPWSKLPLHYRLFHRCLYLISLGNVSITVTFLQLLASLTHWDSYAMKQFLELLNGSTEGIGLRCLFPILGSPMASLLVRLCIPVLFIGSIGVAVALAEIVLLQWTRFSRRKQSTPSTSKDTVTDSEWAYLVSRPADESYIPFPAMALFTSTSLSVIKFFYFGTAITAHEYLFAQEQTHTGIKYVQNHPWVKFKDAIPLIGASIPAILAYDLIFPLSFIYLCWKVRNTFKTPEVQIYIGSLFESFSVRCYWWGIIDILKKLLLALVLQGIPSSSATQSTLVLSILAATQVFQLSVSPWKRRSENMYDAISVLLLIGSMQVSRSGHLTEARGSIYYILVLDVAFVLASVVSIVIEAWRGQTDYQKRFQASQEAGGTVGLHKAPEDPSLLLEDGTDGTRSGADSTVSFSILSESSEEEVM